MFNIPWFDSSDIQQFPDVEQSLSEPDGLLALGGNLSTPTLINAYKNGIFPWFSENQPIMWWSPSKRAIIETTDIHVSKNMGKLIKQKKYYPTVDKCFSEVVNACAKPTATDNRTETWITNKMRSAYCDLHKKGHAHSIEIWNKDDKLVGGLYGVFVNNCFCGESMFSSASNTSKLALIYLSRFLKSNNCKIIDCQLPTKHLYSLGAKAIERKDFIKTIGQTAHNPQLPQTNWKNIWQQY
ncbi:MAG: leucyl/phenylalanyl-tRNA--protein transferase [Gammaproteobacteria bacterium]|nr:leucyl/phenylalanyl-tRNA--protein transferase [Gammaproteobacteria bacterium]